MKWLQATAKLPNLAVYRKDVKNVCIKMWTKECHIKFSKMPYMLGNKYVVGMQIAFIVNETTVE